ncbi:hypothetical protein GCM10007147_44950 [Nocardiopsis kunsanensis]|uniref:Uncharacterized protein n=1 Tax=Nocardiopsis kunsanensis TaxID=141693 RepID=A0A918XKX7_9ACTN|nr:hypothetical protein [Nocardiopsis kunsanensis]GHD37137.1 hypothetical protein GCM10007147_44950 [Nocardiopsis kunsanensis]
MFTRLPGSAHDATRDTSWVQPYALADGSYLHQARCSCGWYSDVFINEAAFTDAVRQSHDRTGQ